jgi:AcrR family transcriptional regulator
MTAHTSDAPVRAPLSREQILRAALAHVDEMGLDALSMHKLGARLGVKAMSLYNHVDGKDGLLDGLVHLLWSDIELLWSDMEPRGASDGDWRERLRRLAQAARETIRRHPQAAPLLMSRPVLPASALRLFGAQLDGLEGAGFQRRRAVEIVRAFVGYAIGSALSELCWWCATMAAESELGRLRRVSQLIPDDVPQDLLAVAMDVCAECDLDGQFDLGLDLMLQGLRPPLEP